MKSNTKTIVGMGLLTAIVIILQALALNIRFGMFSITLVLVPIIVGAALYGSKAGAWLGLVFSVVVLLTDSAAFMAISIPGTIATVLVKGTLAGLCAGVVYRLLKGKSSLFATATASTNLLKSVIARFVRIFRWICNPLLTQAVFVQM